MVRARRREALRGYDARDTATSLSLGLQNQLVAAVTKGLAVGLWAAAYAASPLRLPEWLGGGVLAFAALLVLEDLCYYGFHRAHHEVRFLWAAHVNHHSSTHYNLSTALRQSPATPLTGPWFWLPLALLGFTPAMILTANAWSLIYQFWIHTERIGRLGPLEAVLNTPSHHRVHHGRNLAYLDRNYGGIFIVWDRLFGSFEAEGESVDYGLTKNLETYHPLRAAFHEWAALGRDLARASSLREALGYALRPPGWSPDGSSLTARERQRALPEGLDALRAG